MKGIVSIRLSSAVSLFAFVLTSDATGIEKKLGSQDWFVIAFKKVLPV